MAVNRFCLSALRAFVVAAALAILACPTTTFAEQADAQAFEAAKELGTVEAWDAFLKSYPAGFHADLARAYRNKLTSGAEAPPSASRDNLAPAAAIRLSCSERQGLKSISSDVPARMTFVNVSGMHRAILWLDFQGQPKEHAALNDGESVKVDTFVTHPYMITDGPGNCIEVFTPGAGTATVKLVTPNPSVGEDEEESGKKTASSKKSASRDSGSKSKDVKPKKKSQLVCAKNYKLRNGECVLLQNCGKNAYRSPEGDCYCNKNYEMKNGKCVWKTDKQGLEIQPWKKTGCTGWQVQCAAGNNKACGKYEANCQVN